MDYSTIIHSLDDPIGSDALFQTIVDTPFSDKLHATELGLGIVVLLLADRANNSLHRIALSDTELASGAVEISAKPFHEIVIPLDYRDNILVKAIETQHYQQTEDWSVMFVPELTPEEARFNQAGAGIACSVVYPLISKNGASALGAMIFSYFEPLDEIKSLHHQFMKAYAETVAHKLSNTTYIIPGN